MHDLLIDAARRGIRYRASLAERCVAPTPAAVAELARFREPMPAHGCSADAVLAMLDETGSPQRLPPPAVATSASSTAARCRSPSP